MPVLAKGESMRFWNPLREILHRSEKESPKYFLALILGESKIWAVVFEELAGKVEILGTSCENLSAGTAEIEQEELLEAADRAIAQAEENLPPNVTTTQTILGLENEWVSEGRIKKEYLVLLKKLKEELGLNFIGFVVTIEAICHLLQKEEGVPPTSILVAKNNNILTVVLVQAGRIEKQIKEKLENQSSAQLLEQILRTFKDREILPSRITLFSQDKPEELKQELLSFPWTKTLPFLHFPKVEILEEDFVRRAVVSGFATQMNVEFEVPQAPLEAQIQAEPAKGTTIETDLGFVQEKDILEETGFQEKPAPVEKKLPFSLKLPKVSFKFNLSFPGKIPTFNLSQLKRKISFPILIFIFLFAGYLFLPQATVSIFVTPKILEFEKEATLDPALGASDLNKNKIKTNTVETEVSDSLDGPATGKKEVGEKATGEVTIYNSSAQLVVLNAGTIITGPNNLKFTLDDKVTIASASGDIFSGTTPSKVKVKVTASQIGEESNFPSNTVFNFASLSSVAGKNENPFSGGTKKEVKVVSRQDQDNLTKTLLDRLLAKARDNLLKTGSEKGEKIIEATISQEVLEKKFSRQVNEEGDRLSLSLKVKFKSLSFNESEIQGLFQEQLNQSIPQDFILKPAGVVISFGKTKTVNKVISTSISVKATLLPKIDQKTLKNKIKGKTVQETLQILSTLPNTKDYKIKITPVFPLLPKKLPLREGGIKVEILEHA